MAYDIVVRGGTAADRSGGPSYRPDVGVAQAIAAMVTCRFPRRAPG